MKMWSFCGIPDKFKVICYLMRGMSWRVQQDFGKPLLAVSSVHVKLYVLLYKEPSIKVNNSMWWLKDLGFNPVNPDIRNYSPYYSYYYFMKQFAKCLNKIFKKKGLHMFVWCYLIDLFLISYLIHQA